MTAKPVRLVLEAWRGAPMRQPFKIVADGADIAATGYTLQLLVWDADGAPVSPLLTLSSSGASPNTRVALDGSGHLQGDLFIKQTDLDGLPASARPESRQPLLFRIGFIVTAPAADPAYFGLGDLRVYPRWGVDSLPGATAATGQAFSLDVTTTTLSFDLGAGFLLAAAESAADAATLIAATAIRSDAPQTLTSGQKLQALANLGLTADDFAQAYDEASAISAGVPSKGPYLNVSVLQFRTT